MKIEIGSEWQISSASGREIISATLKSIHDDANDRVFIFDLKYRREAFSQYAQGELVDDYDFSFHQVALSQRRLSKNVSELSAWLSNHGQMELDFSALEQQTFKFWFGIQKGVISSIAKPICRLSFEGFLTKCEIGFVVDQSCIQIFRDSLALFAEQPLSLS